MRELEPPYDKGSQAGGARCHVSGQLKRACGCRSCVGRRARAKGQRKQREAAKASGVPAPKYASQMGHEENYRGPCRIEVKAGKQVQRIATLFLAAEKQSGDARSVGDPRPFEMIVMPDGWAKGEGIVLCRLSQRARVVEAYVNWD